MSFLDDLLNPAPASSSDPHPHSHPPKSQSHSPPAPSASHTHIRTQDRVRRESSSYSERQQQYYDNAPPPISSSYEAASALTALATSGAAASHYSPSVASHFVSPLPPLATATANAILPPLNANARRASYSALPQFVGGDRNSGAHTLPSPTSDLEYYRSSRSPDELRRQSFTQYEQPEQARLVGPVLAPLLQHGAAPASVSATGPELDRGAFEATSKNASVARATSSDVEKEIGKALHSHSESHSQAIITPPPISTASSSSHRHHHTQAASPPTRNMEETGGTEIEQPAPMQIREPSAAAPEAVMTPQAPEPAERKPLPTDASAAVVKDEPTGTPTAGSTPVKDAVRRQSTTQDEADDGTMKAIEAAKNEFGVRAGRGGKAQPSIEEPLPNSPPAGETKTSNNKKRPAPKVKKGQATVKKPPSKKRRVDDDGGGARLSATHRGGGGKKSKSNTPALGSSPAPGSVVSADNESAYASDASSNDNEVFCICRRGDNHTWMIACDGGCEDWFHGKCVNILEDDGELIDKYICPNCAKTSGKVTTWLPGCRNRNCRRPARTKKGNMSKYCSDKCGREFMEGEVRRSEEARRKASGKGEKASKPKRKGITMAEINGEAAGGADSDDDLGPRGGALKASELKALVTSTKGDVTAFRNLGSAGVLSPPTTASPTAERFPNTEDRLSATEKERIEAIGREKDDLRRRRALLKEREKFGQLIRENVAKYAEREKVKPKDVCGYDNRLTWSEAEFKQWRESEEGQQTLSSGVLELPEPKEKDKDKPEMNGNGNGNGSAMMEVDGSPPAQQIEEGKDKKATMCTKKRCERHRQWQKQALADVRFEESTLADQMRGLEREEREMRELGALRGRMESGGLAGEGTVEVVGA